MLLLSVIRHHGSYYSLNVQGERNDKHYIARGGRCEKHQSYRWPWIVILSWSLEKSRCDVWWATVVVMLMIYDNK